MSTKFRGLLNEPLKPILTDNLADFLRGSPNPDLLQKRQELVEQKLEQVFAHYAIEDGGTAIAFQRLALCLLREFIPGFQIADPNVGAGRGLMWTADRLSFLVNEMELYMSSKKTGATHAAQVLAKRDPWKTLCSSSGADTNPAEVLRSRYQQALKKGIPRFATHLYQRELDGDRPPGTYASVLKAISNKKGRRPYV